MLQEAGHIKNIVVLLVLHLHCLYVMFSEVAWVLVPSKTQVHPRIILDLDYISDYLSNFFDYEKM